MANKEELVIRWLEEPVDVACALCKSKKSKKFKKGPVVSLVGGELVCPKCAAIYNKNLWDVCSGYAQYHIERNWESHNYDLKLNDLTMKEPIVPEIELLKIDKYDEPLFKEEERCARCVHEKFSPRNGPKNTK